ncbi:hypothetical protein AGR3A_Cc170262 [Agrobacterium tomkonis CFBP 6623]|uniref:Uncharacterized protein n=1 Tax=Agrobacterium tomkonis CFBP 6623 TaxID=1183432 RepID=A0A1S7NXE1_9HYPH|nr:hypothetical protein AGR3A_Cc170262 [Agrobacterium tomkonis CFBP 6623]
MPRASNLMRGAFIGLSLGYFGRKVSGIPAAYVSWEVPSCASRFFRSVASANVTVRLRF